MNNLKSPIKVSWMQASGEIIRPALQTWTCKLPQVIMHVGMPALQDSVAAQNCTVHHILNAA